MISIIIALLLVIPCFFLWSAIHEFSHYLVARSLRKITEIKFKIYPHEDPNFGFVWASFSWNFEGAPLTDKELAMVSVAPRFMDAIAGLLFPFFVFFGPIWFVVFGSGLVDLAAGSFGGHNESDLMRTARGFNVSPLILKICGWTLFGLSILTSIILMLVFWL